MNPSIEHTPACLARQAAVAEWKAKWPDACPTCGGSGVIVSPGDWVPYGMGNTQLPDNADLCSGCTDIGRCPRCANQALAGQDWLKCEACGWAEGADYPPENDCDCWEALVWPKEA